MTVHGDGFWRRSVKAILRFIKQRNKVMLSVTPRLINYTIALCLLLELASCSKLNSGSAVDNILIAKCVENIVPRFCSEYISVTKVEKIDERQISEGVQVLAKVDFRVVKPFLGNGGDMGDVAINCTGVSWDMDPNKVKSTLVPFAGRSFFPGQELEIETALNVKKWGSGNLQCSQQKFAVSKSQYLNTQRSVTEGATITKLKCDVSSEKPFTAIVSAVSAKFIFPVESNDQFQWNNEGDRSIWEYRWAIHVDDFEFGFFHRSDGPAKNGNLSELLAANNQRENGRKVPGVAVQSACDYLVVLIDGKENVARAFSSHPQKVRFLVEQPGKPFEMKDVIVSYKN